MTDAGDPRTLVKAGKVGLSFWLVLLRLSVEPGHFMFKYPRAVRGKSHYLLLKTCEVQEGWTKPSSLLLGGPLSKNIMSGIP